MSVAVLFVQPDSVYKTIPGVETFDELRDARNFDGRCPVVAHPPCRLWCKLRKFSKAPELEKNLARFAVRVVRNNGGVLEHPAGSLLWADMGLPGPNQPPDKFGGYTIALPQFWFGHLANKATWLYIVGTKQLPPIPLRLGVAQFTVSTTVRRWRKGHSRELPKRLRSATPKLFAEWLIEVARRAGEGRA